MSTGDGNSAGPDCGPAGGQDSAGGTRPSDESPWARENLRWLLLICLVALVVRVLWIATVQPDPRDGRIDDTSTYDDTSAYYLQGRSLADGDGLVDLVEGKPTSSFPPAYGGVLAAVFILPGDDVAAFRVLNVLLGIPVVVGVYYLGFRLWDRRAGLLAAGIMALFPSHIFYSSLLMREPLYAVLVVGVLCLTVAWTVQARAPAYLVVLLGITIAFTALVRGEALTLALVVLVAWLLVYRSWRRTAAHAVLLALGMALVLTPWTVRNAIEVGSPVVTYSGGGVILAEAHNDDAGGRPPLDLEQSVAMDYERDFRDVPRPERAIRKDTEALGDSFDYAVNHVSRELSLAPQRLAWFFRGDRHAFAYIYPEDLSGTPREFFSVAADAYYYVVAAVMVFGLPFWVRRMRRAHVLLWGPFLVYCALWAFVFAGLARYHFPLVPIFAVLAGIGLSSFLQALPFPRNPSRAA